MGADHVGREAINRVFRRRVPDFGGAGGPLSALSLGHNSNLVDEAVGRKVRTSDLG